MMMMINKSPRVYVCWLGLNRIRSKSVQNVAQKYLQKLLKLCSKSQKLLKFKVA